MSKVLDRNTIPNVLDNSRIESRQYNRDIDVLVAAINLVGEVFTSGVLGSVQSYNALPQTLTALDFGTKYIVIDDTIDHLDTTIKSDTHYAVYMLTVASDGTKSWTLLNPGVNHKSLIEDLISDFAFITLVENALLSNPIFINDLAGNATLQLKIAEDLKNDVAFQALVKGDKGDKGDGYDTANIKIFELKSDQVYKLTTTGDGEYAASVVSGDSKFDFLVYENGNVADNFKFCFGDSSNIKVESSKVPNSPTYIQSTFGDGKLIIWNTEQMATITLIEDGTHTIVPEDLTTYVVATKKDIVNSGSAVFGDGAHTASQDRAVTTAELATLVSGGKIPVYSDKQDMIDNAAVGTLGRIQLDDGAGFKYEFLYLRVPYGIKEFYGDNTSGGFDEYLGIEYWDDANGAFTEANTKTWAEGTAAVLQFKQDYRRYGDYIHFDPAFPTKMSVCRWTYFKGVISTDIELVDAAPYVKEVADNTTNIASNKALISVNTNSINYLGTTKISDNRNLGDIGGIQNPTSDEILTTEKFVNDKNTIQDQNIIALQEALVKSLTPIIASDYANAKQYTRADKENAFIEIPYADLTNIPVVGEVIDIVSFDSDAKVYPMVLATYADSEANAIAVPTAPTKDGVIDLKAFEITNADTTKSLKITLKTEGGRGYPDLPDPLLLKIKEIGFYKKPSATLDATQYLAKSELTKNSINIITNNEVSGAKSHLSYKTYADVTIGEEAIGHLDFGRKATFITDVGRESTGVLRFASDAKGKIEIGSTQNDSVKDQNKLIQGSKSATFEDIIDSTTTTIYAKDQLVFFDKVQTGTIFEDTTLFTKVSIGIFTTAGIVVYKAIKNITRTTKGVTRATRP